MRRRTFATVVAVLLSSSLLFTGTAAATVARASATSDATATNTAKPLVTKFFTLIQQKDKAGLDKFLSPAFELQRADGTGSGKADYLQNLPTVQTFELSDFTASRAGDVLVVRYLADATGVVNGKPYTPGPAPRLSVFARNGKQWQIVAHANFNPLNG
ncbi:MAG TPA: nuclear transport factor 2 family protein [Acidimicrobiia bacterium]|nr:nuclear transport factor 2 family protein [Acidimicrobiia bacterium]